MCCFIVYYMCVLQDAVLSLLTSQDAIVKQCAARLFNAFASLSSGTCLLVQVRVS